MFGLPLWLISLIIQVLQRTGALSTAGALIDKSIVSATAHIEKLKTYPSYNIKKNDPFNQGT
jgi:hypothetical protein